jgi:hypothetical protein
MAVYLVTYDLRHKPEKDYEPLLKYIKEHNWAKLSESSYAIVSAQTPQTIFTALSNLIHADDHLLVITLTRPYAGRNNKDVIAWLASNLGSP